MYADVLIWVLPHQFVVRKLRKPENPAVEEISVDIRPKIMRPDLSK